MKPKNEVIASTILAVIFFVEFFMLIGTLSLLFNAVSYSEEELSNSALYGHLVMSGITFFMIVLTFGCTFKSVDNIIKAYKKLK